MKIDYANHRPIKAELSKGTRMFSAVLISFGLLSAIVFPSIPLGGISVYLVTIFSPVTFVLVLLFWLKAPFAHVSSLFPLMLGMMVCLSALVSWTVGFSSVNGRDIVEAIKYVQFLPYFLMIPFLTSEVLKVFHWAIVSCSILVLIVGFIQVSGVSHAVSYLYLGDNSSHINDVISGYRITLTGSDPNIGGVIASFFGIYYFSLYSVYRRFWYLLIFLLFFYLCFLTQSRTALIALLFGLSFYYFFYFRGILLFKAIILALAIAFVVFLVFYLDLSYIYIGIQYALEGKNNSLNVRFENIYFAVQRFMESPIFGIGPAKSSFDTTIDSEYALIIQRYGLIGIFIFSAYIIYLLRLALRNLSSHWGVCLFVFVLMSMLVMITNNIFSGYQLMSLIILLNIACILNERMSNRSIQEAAF